MEEVIVAKGHPGVTSRHPTTFMVTKDPEVGPRGDCVIAVGADKAVRDLGPGLKRAINAGHELVITLKAGGMTEEIHARGHSSLALDHPSDIVVRKSGFTCGRTLAVKADKAAADLPKRFLEALKDPKTKLEILIKPVGHRSSSGSM